MLNINLGTIDRTLRILIGAVLLSLVWAGPKTAWGYFGMLLLVTGAMGYSPLYALFHISSFESESIHRIPREA